MTAVTLAANALSAMINCRSPDGLALPILVAMSRVIELGIAEAVREAVLDPLRIGRPAHVAAAYIVDAIQRGGVVLLVDALDEVTDIEAMSRALRS